MDRRSFFAVGGGFAAFLPGVGAAAVPTAANQPTPLISTYVTNIADTVGRGPLPVKAGSGVELRLVARAYDPDSVMVLSQEEVPLGYLPTNQSRLIAPLMRAGKLLSATVTGGRHGDRPSISISISLEA